MESWIGQKFKAFNITRKVAEENIVSKEYQKIYETFQMQRYMYEKVAEENIV